MGEINETLILIAFVLIRYGIKHQKIVKKVSFKIKNWKKWKKILKIGKKLTNQQNTKTEKQTNLSILCKSSNEFNTIF